MRDQFQFPKGFFWGAASSAYQVEGGNHNDWSEWEKSESRIAELERRGLDSTEFISGKAVDHYNRYEEDFDLAKNLEHNAHRFSIEWSRIEPEEGKFNEKEIEHYRKVLLSLRERNIEPFVTLWHWPLPLWVRDHGGWENKKTVPKFVNYARRIAEEYKDLVRFWMPLNEPGTYIGMGYVQGLFPPQKRNFLRANRVFKNLIQAHNETYDAIKTVDKNAEVGLSHYAVFMEPYQNRWYNKILVRFVDYIRNWRFILKVQGHNDFIGMQYYHHDRISFAWGRGRFGFIDVRNENTWVNGMGWEIYPEGLYHLLKSAGRYNVPIYITENGTDDAADNHRAKFIHEHLQWVARALQDGVDVRGYFYWSLTDNFEWTSGFGPRFGLVEINYKTLERKIRPSALEYKKIISLNSVEI